MSVKDRLPPHEIMQSMTKIAFEQATELLAVKAEEFANTLPAYVDGRGALRAFAAAIRSTNAKRFPKDGAAAQ